ncbi:thioredoxin family protein [Nemorincola caseinilytica]|uniref:Thioredoxin family protein n=1 Tax=Nemorincola caseinilytica TaxID=2054315 RepID=A0ABP8NLW3_9BACT
MKNTFIAIAASVVTLVSGGAYAQSKTLQVGDALPAANEPMKNATDGGEMVYSKAAGKNGLLVMFSCNTCPFVVKNEGTTAKTIEYAREHGIGVVIINSNEAKREGDDSFEAMKRYARKQGYKVPYLADANSTLANAYGANHTPEIFLFDKKSKLVYKGAMSDNPGTPEEAKVMYINNAIDAVVAGKQPDPASTKSIGCSIKRKA